MVVPSKGTDIATGKAALFARHPQMKTWPADHGFGVFELHVSKWQLVSLTSDAYPISPKEHGTEFLMDHRHLWLRSKRQHAIVRVRHAIVQAVRRFFDDRDFTLVDAPR